MFLVMKKKLFFQFTCLNFDDTLDLLLISNHYVYIKDFNRLMFNKNKCKNRKMIS